MEIGSEIKPGLSKIFGPQHSWQPLKAPNMGTLDNRPLSPANHLLKGTPFADLWIFPPPTFLDQDLEFEQPVG